MSLPLYLVDAFTTQPFAGNPAAIVILADQPDPNDDRWMPQLAGEMNQAETAYAWRLPDGAANDFGLRWFTPKIEVDLCGYATLAAAHVLFNEYDVPPPSPIRFHTRSGVLTVEQAGGRLQMDFPSTSIHAEAPPTDLLDALGISRQSVIYSGRTKFDWFLELQSTDQVLAIRPDFRPLGQVTLRGVIVTAAQPNDTSDFISRFFAPAAGIDEDSVTGSAHCALGPFWARRLDKQNVVGYQASARGGLVEITVVSDERVLLGGTAVTVLKGELVA